MVCGNDWEHDHPQKFLRVREDKQSVPFVREQNDDVFLQTCSVWTCSPMADYATADCALTTGNTSIEFLRDLYYPSTTAVAEIAISGYAICEGDSAAPTGPTPTYTFDGWFVPQYA
jgi:hypothetical protein